MHPILLFTLTLDDFTCQGESFASVCYKLYIIQTIFYPWKVNLSGVRQNIEQSRNIVIGAHYSLHACGWFNQMALLLAKGIMRMS